MTTPSWPDPALRERLAAPRGTHAELLAVLGEVEATVPAARTWEVGVSGNLTPEPAAAYFKKQAYLAGLGCRFMAGAFDQHLGNVATFLAQGVRHLVIADLFDNLVPAFEARVATMAEAEVAAVLARVRGELGLVLEAARPFEAVFLLRYHRLGEAPLGGPDPVAAALAAFDAMHAELARAHPHVTLVDAADLVAAVGRAQAFSPRFRHAYQAPYAGPFWEELARRLLLATRHLGAYYKKALVLDADDTLWGGIVGEAGLEGIALDPHAYPGNVYWAVQHALLALQRRGVLLALCSRNEAADVEAVLAGHPHAVLRAEHFVVRSLGWRDKADRVAEIARELGLGLDALVFLDDSPFECEAVRTRLPGVAVRQVPKHLHEYPALLAELQALFPPEAGAAGADKTEQYRARAAAIAEGARFADHDAYLRSLGIRVAVRRDDPAQAARVAELSQKSNQFNLTTRRYTREEIAAAMADPDRAVYALAVRDRFGDAGTTGAVVVRFDGPVARVEACFLSCRVLGRGIERAPWNRVVADARARGGEAIEAEFRPTARNGQVAAFYESLGLAVVARDEAATRYRARLADLPALASGPLEIDDVG